MSRERGPRIAFGPALPGWGSWEWLGADLLQELAKECATVSFTPWDVPDADVVIVVKHLPPREWVAAVCPRSPVIYCPVDYYDSAAQIDRDGPVLRRFARVVVHCEALRRYFAPYAPVEYLDHPVKFVEPLRDGYLQDGYVLWVGVRTNLPPLVAWLNRHPLPGELLVLTNLETPERKAQPGDFGFPAGRAIRIDNWSPQRHREALAQRGALDIKGDDFRSRHKPPAKAIDFLASGVPLAMNGDNAVVEHLARMGFEVASPLEPERWFSRDYGEETRRFGGALRELLSRERVGRRYRRLLEQVWSGWRCLQPQVANRSQGGGAVRN